MNVYSRLSAAVRLTARPPQVLIGQREVAAHRVAVRMEVRRLDDERVALPAAARITKVLAHRGGKVRPAVERDDSRVVNFLHLDCDVLRRLHDAIDAHVRSKEIGEPIVDAAIGQRHVLSGRRRASEARHQRRTRSGPLRRRRRQPAVGWIDDQRGAVLEIPVWQPVLTIRAGGAQSCWRPVGEQRLIQGVTERGSSSGENTAFARRSMSANS